MTSIAAEHSTTDLATTAPKAAAHNLADCLRQYDWHYSLTIKLPQPRLPDWMTPFGEAINCRDLFPHGRRYTTEPPGWIPIRYRDIKGTDTLTVLIAVPPGALRHFSAAYDMVRPVLERATGTTFIEPSMRVGMATRMKVENLLKSIDLSTVEFTTAFVREHHESWDCDWVAINHGE